MSSELSDGSVQVLSTPHDSAKVTERKEGEKCYNMNVAKPYRGVVLVLEGTIFRPGRGETSIKGVVGSVPTSLECEPASGQAVVMMGRVG